MANPPDAVHFRMPGVPELDASIELEHRPRRPSVQIISSPGQTVSEHFKRLLDQLLEQHIKELAERGSPEIGESPLLEAEKDQGGTVLSFLKEQRSRTTCSISNSVMCQRNRQLREVEASEVLDALQSERSNTEDLESKFKTTDQIVANVLAQSDTKFDTQLLEDTTWAGRIRRFLKSNRYEFVIATIMTLNVLWMALELQVYGYFDAYDSGLVSNFIVPPEERSLCDTLLLAGDLLFAALFVIDVSLRMVFLKFQFWKHWINYLDLIVTILSVCEVVIALLPIDAFFFRLVRFGKLFRTLRMMTMTSILSSLQLLTKCLTASVDMLFWTFCLLTFMQCVAGIALSTLCRPFIIDENQPQDVRESIFKYYGTFTRSILTMFEVLFANWGPPCRALTDNVSEWFSLFFLFYRCVIGFAVLNVVGAVFVQQTMKMANSDEELAFRQKERETANYARKVRKLFSHMDDSGDGALSHDEFAKLVSSPKLKFWMSQLELEYHDLLSLFEFLDNGDGQITLTEFIEGSTRLRGSAKALDVWRLETKVELLSEEILKVLHAKETDADVSSYVRAAFKNSSFKHMITANK
ncbi:Zinc transporter ZupT [Durusdinium trenchii]|uniref:Zinc transporter ZupT n=1 Tax=Durusdinium trenchii TaxID=1381693 RepID=A0ABP0MRV5_9DINO